ALAGAIRAQAAVVRELTVKVLPHLPLADKKPLWDSQRRLRELEQERIEAFAQAHASFGQALAADPGSEEASDGAAGLFAEAYLEAEARRDRREMLLNRNFMAGRDVRGKHAARLEAPGTLTLRTYVMACDCCRPAREAGWRVEYADRCTVPWRDGRPRPDLPLEDEDLPVPALRMFPEGARWGHSPSCARREATGIEVSVARFEEKDRRLMPGSTRILGTTPLAGVVLPRGSWLCTVRPPGAAALHLPVRIDRGGDWLQDVTLHDVPDGFCFVPAGPFLFGGEYAGAPPETTCLAPDFFVARFPVTFAEYLDFLNALAAEGLAAEARTRIPRSSTRLHFRGEGPFLPATPEEDPDGAPDLRWPVYGVSWHDALAYAAWRSRRDGVRYSLPHEQEFEKAARGVDGRIYPWGEEWDGAFSHTDRSLAGPARPLPPGSHPPDESPCGARDLAGGMQTWCFNWGEKRYRHFAIIRGGSWTTGPDTARSPWRLGSAPENVGEGTGIRLVIRPGS
ncbi:MAG: serine/threonine protein kinase, partial [Planctomycetota bacterium]